MTSKESPCLKKMEEYLSTNTVLPCDGKELYEDANLLQSSASEVQRYCDFAKVNSGRKDLTFAVTDSNEDTESSGPAVILYCSGIAEDFEPPSKPRNLKSKDIAHNNAHLEWTAPEYGAKTITSYSVSVFCSTTMETKSWTSLSVPANELSIVVKDLFPSTVYHFKVQAVTKVGVSVESDCHNIKTAAKPLDRPADKIIQKSNVLTTTDPMCYQLPLKLVVGHSSDRLYKYEIGTRVINRLRIGVGKPERVMIVLGATGAGKSTLINAIANYVFGVDWKDNFRFKIISDESKGKTTEEQSQAHSQTKDITAYTLY